MARPASKPDLINAANEQFEKMWKLIGSMTDAEQNKPFNFVDDVNKKEAHWSRDNNLRDVLVHLYEWHQLLLCWVKANQDGEEKPFLPAPYNWKTYGDLNFEFWKKHQNTSYEKSKDMVRESHSEVMALIEPFSDDALFVKGSFPWTGGSTLGSYCVSVTASHYDWAMKKIKRHIKTLYDGTAVSFQIGRPIAENTEKCPQFSALSGLFSIGTAIGDALPCLIKL